MAKKHLKFNISPIPLKKDNPLYWFSAFDFGDIKNWLPDDYKGRGGKIKIWLGKINIKT